MNVVHGNRLTGLTAVILAGAMLLPIGCSSLLKKAPPRRSSVPQYAYPTYPGLKAQKKKPKSWVDSWFGPQEPEQPSTVGEWMKRNKRLDL